MRFLLVVVGLLACSSPQAPVVPQVPPVTDRRCLCPCPVDAGVADAVPDAMVPPWQIDAAPPIDAAPRPIDAAPPLDAVIADAAVPPDAPPPPIPTGHPRIMLGSQAPRLKAALAGPTPAAARWRTTVNTWLSGGDVYNFAAWNGALLGALTSDARYCTKAVAQVETQVATAEIKIAAGAAPEVAGDSYLQVGEMVGDLALVYDWCSAQMSAAQRARWITYANQAVWNVWHASTATWGGKVFPWTAWGTNDPSNNYYYSFLRATMLLGLATKDENAQAATWITQFRDTKVLGQLVPEFNRDLVDGGSREGTGYGVALRNLFELYALWQWSTGENLADRTGHTKTTLSTVMHQILPGFTKKAPTGDQSRDSTATLFDYDRAELLELAALYPGARESMSAVSLLAASGVPVMGSGFMLGYDFVYQSAGATPMDLPLVRYASGIGQIYARTSWANGATWINLIGGAFTQSHAHEDQGALMIYKGGWLAYDAVITSHSGVRMSGTLVGATPAHSLVRIDQGGAPVPQREGTTSRVLALHQGPGYVFAAVDTTAAYGGNSAVTLVRRQVLWLQPDVVIVQDHVVSSSSTAQIWQLVVPTSPVIAGDTATITSTGHSVSAKRVSPPSGTWTTFDFRSNSDFTGGWRLDQVQPGGDRTYVTVLAIDGATSTATPSVVFSADVGASFTLDGRQVTLGAGIEQ